jgi:hypothetical protein
MVPGQRWYEFDDVAEFAVIQPSVFPVNRQDEGHSLDVAQCREQASQVAAVHAVAGAICIFNEQDQPRSESFQHGL